MINKNKLVFDPADAGNSDYVGSYVIGADGVEISHTLSGGKDGLDVYLINSSIVVTATDLDIRDLNAAQDNVAISDGTDTLAINADGSINITDNGGSLTVDATNLDIRDLVFATDKVDVSGSTVAVSLLPGGLQGYADGSVWSAGSIGTEMLAIRKDASGPLTGVADGDFSPLQTDANGLLKVNATMTAAFQYAEDSASADGDIGAFILAVRHDADTSLVGTDGDYGALQLDSLGRLKVAADISVVNGFEKAEDSASANADIGGYVLSVREDVLAISTSASGDYQSFKTDALGRLYNNASSQVMANAAVSVLVTATDLAATDLVNRKRILIQNLGSKKIYIGKDATVTTANGIELFAGASMELDIGPAVNVHAISSSGTQDVRVMELA